MGKSGRPGVVGRNIIRLLAKKDIGVTELAKRGGFRSRSTITDLMSGATRGATEDTIERLAKGFGVPRSEIVEEHAGSQDVEAVIKEFRRTAEAATLEPPFDEDDADRMRGDSRYVWTGKKPTAKALKHLVISLRLLSKVEDRS